MREKGGNYEERLQLFSSRDYRVRGGGDPVSIGQHPRARHRKKDESFMISLFYLIVIIDTVSSTQRSDLHLIQKKKKSVEKMK